MNTKQGFLALSRFGYGPRGDGDLAAAASDPRGFLKAELLSPGISLMSGPALLGSASAAQAFFADNERKKAEREAAVKLASNMGPNLPPDTMMMPGAAVAKQQPSPEQMLYRAEALAKIRHACLARAGFVERLVAFWSNHFCISVAKSQFSRVTAGAFEREAIRPHVLGTFKDMLLAVESHPAMLHYLDNAQSIGPNSKEGLKAHKGLNENLAREIMELHTLGVDGGYTQEDVTSLAKILTGWSSIGPQGKNGEPGTFFFNANTHEPGNISLLGAAFPEGGFEQGQAALTSLTQHPSCAKFIASKFAASFVSDQPSPALVNHLAGVFQASQGDLKALTLALIEADEAWSAAASKFKTPYEFLISVNRGLDRVPEDPGQFLNGLNTLGMPLWAPPGPNGYADTFAAWAAPEAMKLRLDVAAQIAAQLKDPPNPSLLFDALYGDFASQPARQAVARAETPQQGLAILFMSPEMQQR